MTPMEIALLVIGVIIFVLSFLLPAGSEKKTQKQIDEEQEEIRKLMEQELAAMKLRVNESSDESIDYAVDRAERLLERISNEKIIAVNEYSQTILEEINKNHQEVMFLYDMLRDKQTDITNSVRKADAVAKEMEALSANAKKTSAGLRREMTAMSVSAKGLTDEQKAVFDFDAATDAGAEEGKLTGQDRIRAQAKKASENRALQASDESSVEAKPFVPLTPETVEVDMQGGVIDVMSGTVYNADGVPTGDVNATKGMQATPVKEDKPEYTSSSSAATNNNQRILELHEQGMPTVDIAKELKLGVGEVKLVIDLYK